MKGYLLTIIAFFTIIHFCPARENVKIYSELNEDDSLTFFADNSAFCSIHVSISFPVFENLSAAVDLPFETILPARANRFELFDLNVINDSIEPRYNIRFVSLLGNPDAEPDDSFLYLFPFAQGQRFQVMQGWNDYVSHNGRNRYAVDFGMPVGTPVHAARCGVVVQVKQDSNRGGNNRRYESDANFIVIYHSDGTFGNYFHLMKNGAVVTPGDVIEEGQKIGYSGNTGFAAGPHLHFVVTVRQRNGTMVSRPFRFICSNSEGIIPIHRKFYESIHREQEEFYASVANIF